jgi:hypothetical protein
MTAAPAIPARTVPAGTDPGARSRTNVIPLSAENAEADPVRPAITASRQHERGTAPPCDRSEGAGRG